MSRAVWVLVLLIMPFAAAHADTPATPDAPPPAITRVTEKLPVSAFAQLDFVERARLSPDGNRFAGVLGIDGKQNIAIFPMFTHDEKPVRFAIPEKTRIDWIQWVGNDNIIAGLRALVDVEGDNWYLQRIIAFNRVTGKLTKPLWDMGAQNAGDVLWVPHDGSHEILLAAQTSIFVGHDFWPKVFRVDIEKDKKLQILDGSEGVMDWSADSAGIVRSGVSEENGGLQSRLLYRHDRSGFFHTVDRADGRKNEGLTRPFLFLPDGDEALVIGHDKDHHATIDEYDMAHNKFVKTRYTSPGIDVEPVVAADHVTLLGARSEAHGVDWFDPKLAELQTQFAKAVPTATVDITSLSDDRTKMLVLIHGADMPGAIYFYQTEEGVLHKVAAIKDQIGNHHLAEAKMIRYKARDGLEIEAKLTVPPGRPLKNLPIVMLPHGGPWAHDDMDFDYLSQFLANRGYVVVQPNFRGSDGYGDAFEHKGDGQIGLAMQDDITDALRWAVSQGYADPKRACIFGWSYGGYAAMWGLVKDPDQYRCGISMAGVSSVNKQMRIYDNLLNEREAKYRWGLMSNNFDAVSPLSFVDKIKAPLLLLHGKLDVTVDVSQSRKMNAKMLAAGKTVLYIEMPLADHYAQRQADRVTILTELETFLNKYNPADTTVAAAN